MTTRTKLANLGVSLIQAHDFVMANLNSPATIYQAARQHDINSQMLADIVSIDFPGLSASDVEAFFEGQDQLQGHLGKHGIVVVGHRHQPLGSH